MEETPLAFSSFLIKTQINSGLFRVKFIESVGTSITASTRMMGVKRSPRGVCIHYR